MLTILYVWDDILRGDRTPALSVLHNQILAIDNVKLYSCLRYSNSQQKYSYPQSLIHQPPMITHLRDSIYVDSKVVIQMRGTAIYSLSLWQHSISKL